ncbi:GatB/YqeY domain-containing protein [Alkaliphilus transvaalensis]|uniref:GatB/YqeY domain-containing protein n=1 Tax=Alkaliphilus transvaalensis TaxID=114628 RepID=UPI00047A53C0|nr:GatB/YqeY domain-containing protein [Alkaliphilus transvaalensis]
MSLKDQLTNDLKEAMKNKEQLRKNVITMVRADIKQIEVDKRIELGDEDVVDIIAKQVKQRRDALDEFEKGGREDLVDQARQEVEILLKYLPQQLSEEEIVKLVSETILEVGASTMKDMGKVMAAIVPKTKGRADGKLVNEIVKKYLQS